MVEFDAATKNYAMQAEKLRDAARTKDLAATEAVAKEFGRQACGSCHTPFRVPPPQQQAPAPPQQQPTR
jgi:cytochrome c556